MYLSDFDFDLPPELIASRPLDRRDASRMLVVGGVKDSFIADLPKFIAPGDVLVLNDSKVIPARFIAVSEAGREYEFTLHTNLSPFVWKGMAKKFTSLKIGEELSLSTGDKVRVLKIEDDGATLEFLCGDVFSLLDEIGKMPLPPYMKRDDDAADRERYQTVYADSQHIGSMAAPTAGLHFTPELLDACVAAGARIVRITLHVGAGTFLPVKTDDLSKHKMHSEFGVITESQAKEINAAARVIAVGTTSLRLMESATSTDAGERVRPFNQATDIFITPGYKFKTADVLLTNFHLPKSTLFMLVSAFAGLCNMKAAYAHAVLEKYRFFSYGDCCLLYRNDG